MRTLLTIIETLCGASLGLLGIIVKRLTISLRRFLIVFVTCVLLLTVGINGFLNEKREGKLKDEIEKVNGKLGETNDKLGEANDILVEIRNQFFGDRGEQVMESPKEVLLAQTQETSSNVRIIVPQDGSILPWLQIVEGTVADTDAEVWVIVHPMEVSDFWVQPRVTVRKDGAWNVCAYIGSGPDSDIGKQFEIMAVANPKYKLNEWYILGSWPDAQWSSQVITVTRE